MYVSKVANTNRKVRVGSVVHDEEPTLTWHTAATVGYAAKEIRKARLSQTHSEFQRPCTEENQGCVHEGLAQVYVLNIVQKRRAGIVYRADRPELIHGGPRPASYWSLIRVQPYTCILT